MEVVGKKGIREGQSSAGSEKDRGEAQVRDGWRMGDLLERVVFEGVRRGKSGPCQESARVAEEEGHMDVVGMDGSAGADSRNGSEGDEGIGDDTGDDDADSRNVVVAEEVGELADRRDIQLAARKGLVSEVALEVVRHSPPKDRMNEAARPPGEEVESTEEGQGPVLVPRSDQEVREAEAGVDSSDLGGRIRRSEERTKEDGSHAQPLG